MSLTGDTSQTNFAPKAFYCWEAPGKAISVNIDFELVDRLSAEVQRGLQREIVEAGGILLGTRTDGNGPAFTIEDFEPVPCSYLDGPRYRLAGADLRRFEQILQRWRQARGRRIQPVGFYRGDSGGLTLEARDRELLSRNFAPGEAIALLAKPRTGRPVQAAIFFPEGGRFQTDRSYREFPLRREELGGGKATTEVEAPVNGDTITSEFAGGRNGGSKPPAASPASESTRTPFHPATDQTAVPKRTLRLRGGWLWIPLSFIFLLMGTVLGFQVALSVRSKVVDTPPVNPYALQLTATPSAESVHLRWDRNAPAVQNAENGRLVIEEDGRIKNVDLDAGHLRNGSVIYRQAGDRVSFRLELFLKERVTVAQSVEYAPVIARPAVDTDG